MYLNKFLIVILLEKLILLHNFGNFSKNIFFPFLGALGLIRSHGFSLTTFKTVITLVPHIQINEIKKLNKVDNVLSVGLANLQVFTSITNEVLNQNLDTFDEAETKEWYRSYLKDEKLTAKKFTIGSAITFAVSFILCIIFGSGNVAFIFFLLSFVSFVCFILFGGKFLYYSKKVK